jgi:hypothetical protein
LTVRHQSQPLFELAHALRETRTLDMQRVDTGFVGELDPLPLVLAVVFCAPGNVVGCLTSNMTADVYHLVFWFHFDSPFLAMSSDHRQKRSLPIGQAP